MHLYCVKCEKKIPWGNFAYNQEMCLKCFQGFVADISEELDDEKADAVRHLYNCLMETFGYKLRLKRRK